MHTLCLARCAGDLLTDIGLVILIGVAVLAGIEFAGALAPVYEQLVQHDPAPVMLGLAVCGMIAVNLWFALHVRYVYTAAAHGGQRHD